MNKQYRLTLWNNIAHYNNEMIRIEDAFRVLGDDKRADLIKEACDFMGLFRDTMVMLYGENTDSVHGIGYESKRVMSKREIISYVFDALHEGKMVNSEVELDIHKGPTKIIIEVVYE